MSGLEVAIDRLYSLPLTEFTAARNALARSHTGAAAAGIRRLPKPTTVAWAVNQLYWRERRSYDALIRASERVRAALSAIGLALPPRRIDL